MIKKIIFVAALLAFVFVAQNSMAMTAKQLDKKSQDALEKLCKNNPKAQQLVDKAVAVLVFPDVIKAGFFIGGQRGDGVLYRKGVVQGYYNTTSASYGLQIGVQKYAYVLFFMDEKSLGYLHHSDGFELGGAPDLTVINSGFVKSLSTLTLQKGIYALFFDQKGLMAGLSVQGTKITEYIPTKG